MTSLLEKITAAVELACYCRAAHTESVPVIEKFGGETIWEGFVEVFGLSGHHSAMCCYGWSYEHQGVTRFVTILHQPPVDSPHAAVRAAIARGQQK